MSRSRAEGRACAERDEHDVTFVPRGDAGRMLQFLGANVGDDETPAEAGYVDLGAKAVRLTAGAYHTCALLADRTARCWGANSDGQLGDNSVTARNAPVAVAAE